MSRVQHFGNGDVVHFGDLPDAGCTLRFRRADGERLRQLRRRGGKQNISRHRDKSHESDGQEVLLAPRLFIVNHVTAIIELQDNCTVLVEAFGNATEKLFQFRRRAKFQFLFRRIRCVFSRAREPPCEHVSRSKTKLRSKRGEHLSRVCAPMKSIGSRTIYSRRV